MIQVHRLSLLPLLAIVLLAAGAASVLSSSENSNGVLPQTPTVDGSAGDDGEDGQCPLGIEADPCPVKASVGFPTPRPGCPEDGFTPFFPIAAGVSQSVGSYEDYDDDPANNFEATAYSSENAAGFDSPFVKAVTGELVIVQSDLSLEGKYFDFHLGRTYRSSNYDYNGVAGSGWEISTNRTIQVGLWGGPVEESLEPLSFAFASGSGQGTEAFSRSFGNPWFSGARGGVAEFDASTGDIIVYSDTGTKERFDNFGSGDWFFPVSYADTWGKSTTLSYTASSYSETDYSLDVITDELGRTLTYEYSTVHGRLTDIILEVGGNEIARIEFEYDDRGNGQFTLKKVIGLELATEDGSGQLSFVRQVQEYTYWQDNSGYWFLNGIKNGNGQLEYQWVYSTSVIGQVISQKDRPGSSIRAEGVHTYNYNTPGMTAYIGPDGEERNFHFDSYGRIVKRQDKIGTTWRDVIYAYTDPNCSSCALLTMVTYPDGSYEEMEYDADGNLTTKWWYPPAGANVAKRVERWAYQMFDPENGELRTRLLEHELARDAHSLEDSSNDCNHPTCTQTAGLDGHIVHYYNWSADGLTLEGVDRGSIQSSGTNSASMIHRQESFKYFDNDGRMEYWQQLENSAIVAQAVFGLSGNGNYYASKTLSDPINGGSWVTNTVRDNVFLRVLEITGPDGVTTAYSADQTGRVYWVGEDFGGATAQRNNDLRYDAAGRLVKMSILAPGGLTELRTLSLDENGYPFEQSYTGPRGLPKTTTLTWTAGGRLTSTVDWRGWERETIYGEGAFMLPVKVQEKFGGKTRTVWDAGISGGYDQLGRLLYWENAMQWKNYRQYDGLGRLRRSFAQTDASHYAAREYHYDARGFVDEVEVGAILGSPDAVQQMSWLQHHTIGLNLAGHVLGRSVFESGATDEARRTLYEIDGRGRPEQKTAYMGDRNAGQVNATAVVEEFAFDARNRVLFKSLLSAGASSSPVTQVFYDHKDSELAVEIETQHGQGANALIEKVRTEYTTLGMRDKAIQYEWLAGSYTGGSRTTTFLYDGLDRLTRKTDPLGVSTEWVLDDLGRATQESRKSSAGTSQTTFYDFDATYGYLDHVTDADGKVTQYEVATSDWLHETKVTYPDGRWLQNTSFDDLDRVVSTVDSRGITHLYDYDFRYLESDSTNVATLPNVIGDDELKWFYDRMSGSMTSSEVWRGGTRVWETLMDRNDLGELTSETQGLGTSAYTWDFTYGYGGELRDLTYPSVLGLDSSKLTYDGGGRLNTVAYTKDGNPFALYTMDHAGRRVTGRAESQSNIGAVFGYDGYGRWNSAQWEYQAGSSPITLDGEVRFIDDAGRVTSRQRVLDTLGDVFVHDGFGRMQAWYSEVPNANSSNPNTAPGTYGEAERYTLNDVYARTSVEHEDSAGALTTTGYAPNEAQFYDLVGAEARTQVDGYLNSDGNYYYRWGAWGKLMEVEEIVSGVVIRTHQYDASGRRVRTTKKDGTNTETTRYIYWRSGLAGSFVEGPSLADIRTYGFLLRSDEEALVVVEASSDGSTVNGSYEFARDFQGSVLAMIDRGTGQVVERYRYSPSGETTIEDTSGNSLAVSAYGNNRMFMSRVYDAELGIYDLRNRWYDPGLGSFLSPDPLLAIDSWNMYQYGFASPATWMDPFGLNQEPGNQEPDGVTVAFYDGSDPGPELPGSTQEVAAEHAAGDDGFAFDVDSLAEARQAMGVLFLIHRLWYRKELRVSKIIIIGHGSYMSGGRDAKQMLADHTIEVDDPDWPILVSLVEKGGVVELTGCFVGNNLEYITKLALCGGCAVMAHKGEVDYDYEDVVDDEGNETTEGEHSGDEITGVDPNAAGFVDNLIKGIKGLGRLLGAK